MVPYRHDTEVPATGRIEFDVPLPAGAQVTVLVVERQAEELDDLLAAAASSTEFWDNELDDEDWNDA